MKKLFLSIVQIGHDPADDLDLQLRKSLLVICSIPFIFAGILWGVMYYAVGEPLAAAIPFSYGIFSTLSVIYFGITRRFELFRFSQLLLILILPFLLMLVLGGYIKGSAVIMWALICPLGAMLFDEIRIAIRWLLAFLVLVVASGFLPSYTGLSGNISSETAIYFFAMNLAGVSAIIFSMVYYFVGKKIEYQEKSEALLLNILPKEIVSILKDEHRVIADHYESTSVLFADVVNFTPLSVSMKPAELVDMLNEVFSQFDVLTEKYDVEKIKTIGDCYMVASGIPTPRKDHAQSLINLALDMTEYVNTHDIQGHKLSFRFGISSGAVVAGVIGRKKFSYDLWGDVVNTASRMESYGSEGNIQITRDTYEIVKDEFECLYHGVINIKGKGETETWYVQRKKCVVEGGN